MCMSWLNPNPPEDVFELAHPKKEPESFLVAGLFGFFPWQTKLLPLNGFKGDSPNVFTALSD